MRRGCQRRGLDLRRRPRPWLASNPTTIRVMPRPAWADGFATWREGEILEAFYPAPALGPPPESDADPPAASHDGAATSPASKRDHEDPMRGVRRVALRTFIEDLDIPPAAVDDVYLRLHLLSHRLVVPNDVNLEGIFGILPNVAWTSLGPVHPADLPSVRLKAASAGLHLEVHSVDKFPRMADYVVPPGVRIADASRVRLGAHLASGTTVMHEGFVNFNAGTLGTAMVEGRISQGVVVGDASDVGGGASTQGTLSGGGKERVALGERCLLGANSGLGIALGDDCVVEAGLYLLAGTVVLLPDGTKMKARSLSGRSGLLFRRNSLSGAVEVLPRTSSWGDLNSDLHVSQ